MRAGLQGWFAAGVLAGFVAAWLGPIGLGGKILVGGDVTQFFLGLFQVLGERMRQGTVPYWNDRWGFGFPGVAESQMGVYYPPHWVLYGLMPPELGFTWSLVFHTGWSALGAWWCARQWGVGRWGAVVSGMAYAGCGFFVIHRVHPWAATCGSWMPWAWGLAWCVLAGARPARAAWQLSAVLGIQLLPGHFQIAFITQVTIGLMAAWMAWEGRGRMREGLRRGGFVMAAVVAAFAIGLAQVWPTAELAARAAGGRDFEYLSAFAVPPWMLVSYVAPGLFHFSPLWREVAWDPFHAMPEEHQGYVGLVGLWLALGCLAKARRKADVRVRVLGVILLGSLVLSFGPYVPGFGWLIQVPGFSFFRAPARWGVATMLALSLLAGLGFEGLADSGRLRRSLALFGFAAILLPSLYVGVFEAMLATPLQEREPLVQAMNVLGQYMPWQGEGGFEQTMRQARRITQNPIVQQGLLRQGIDPATVRLATDRSMAYREELPWPMLLGCGLMVLAMAARGERVLRGILAVLLAVDLIWLAQHRDFSLTEMRPLDEQSALLARLSRDPGRGRVIDPLGNFLMRAGLSPVAAYRTLNLPIMEVETARASGSITAQRDVAGVAQGMRRVGAAVRVLDPIQTESLRIAGVTLAGMERIEDRKLASWMYGERGLELLGPGAQGFGVWRLGEGSPLAWLMRGSGAESIPGFERPAEDAASGRDAWGEGLPARWERPERVVVDLSGAGGDRGQDQGQGKGKALVVLSVLHDPQWEAGVQRGGALRRVPIIAAFRSVRAIEGGASGAWMAIEVELGEDERMVLEYHPRRERMGQLGSMAAWTIWLLGGVWMRRRDQGQRERKSRSKGASEREKHD
jgi:hypothetical protein